MQLSQRSLLKTRSTPAYAYRRFGLSRHVSWLAAQVKFWQWELEGRFILNRHDHADSVLTVLFKWHAQGAQASQVVSMLNDEIDAALLAIAKPLQEPLVSSPVVSPAAAEVCTCMCCNLLPALIQGKTSYFVHLHNFTITCWACAK